MAFMSIWDISFFFNIAPNRDFVVATCSAMTIKAIPFCSNTVLMARWSNMSEPSLATCAGCNSSWARWQMLRHIPLAGWMSSLSAWPLEFIYNVLHVISVHERWRVSPKRDTQLNLVAHGDISLSPRSLFPARWLPVNDEYVLISALKLCAWGIWGFISHLTPSRVLLF